MSAYSILITGASSGIGAGIAQLLAQSGHRIFASDLNTDAVENMVAALPGTGHQAITLDVTDDTQVKNLTRQLNSNTIDVLINNAGIQHVEALESFPMDKWNLLIQVMLVGVARVTQAILPGMSEQNFGRIINIGSIHAQIASPYKSAYISAKHGLLGFSKTLALELADKNITVNTVCPAYVKTPLVEKQIAAQAKAHNLTEDEVIHKIMLEPMPKKAFISMEELAGTCEFLISDYAKNITAQTITLDGGWTAK